MPVYQSGSSRSRPNLYLPDGCLDGWNTAKGRVGTTPPSILCLGDSITAGAAPLTDLVAKNWTAVVKTALLAKYGWPLRAEYWHNQGVAYSAPGCPYAGPLNGHSFGSVPMGFWYCDALNGTASPIQNWGTTFTSPYACTDMDLWWFDNWPGSWRFAVDIGSSGTFTYSIDGATAQTGTQGVSVTVTNVSVSSNSTANVVRKITLRGLPSGVHTINIGYQSAQFYVAGTQGVTCYPTGPSTAGLNFARMGASSFKAAYVAAGTLVPPNVSALLGGRSTMNGVVSTTGGANFPVGPDLAIIMLGVNDTIDATADQFGAGIEQLILGLRMYRPTTSIVLVVEPLPTRNVADVDVSSTYANTAQYGAFIARLNALAALYSCALVNIHARWGLLPGAAGFMTNNIHWQDAGHADVGAVIAGIL